jgi:hypothetical protein
MATPSKTNQLYKLLFLLAAVIMICVYSCNSSGSTDEKKDTTTAAKDTTMKMGTDSTKMDSVKKDTSGKGGQPTPTGH